MLCPSPDLVSREGTRHESSLIFCWSHLSAARVIEQSPLFQNTALNRGMGSYREWWKISVKGAEAGGNSGGWESEEEDGCSLHDKTVKNVCIQVEGEDILMGEGSACTQGGFTCTLKFDSLALATFQYQPSVVTIEKECAPVSLDKKKIWSKQHFWGNVWKHLFCSFSH